MQQLILLVYSARIESSNRELSKYNNTQIPQCKLLFKLIEDKTDI